MEKASDNRHPFLITGVSIRYSATDNRYQSRLVDLITDTTPDSKFQY